MPNVWPPSLPQVQLIGTGVTRIKQFIETPMDVGPNKRRRTSQINEGEVSIPLLFTATQVGVFRTFWETTLTDGIASFEWEDPVDDTTVEYEILEYPTFQLTAGDAGLDGRLYKGTLKLRRLP